MAIDKNIIKQAQAEQRGIIANNRLAVLQSIDELESIGGKDNYQESLRTILAAYPEGIRQSVVKTVLPDTKLLADALVALKSEMDDNDKSGQSVILKLKAPALAV